MQLVATFTVSSDFKSTFDADAENRRAAGLTMLQMWHDADDASRTLCLFEVNDRAKANDWVAKARALGNLTATQFLRTA